MSARKLVPYILAGIGVGLCLLVIASAGLVAYDRATRPAPQEVACAGRTRREGRRCPRGRRGGDRRGTRTRAGAHT